MLDESLKRTGVEVLTESRETHFRFMF